jgi:transposase-like protein
LSANVVSRLKAQWADEHVAWSRRDMSESHYVYWWVDGIHTGLRSENSDGQCLLVIIGVKPDGSKGAIRTAISRKRQKTIAVPQSRGRPLFRWPATPGGPARRSHRQLQDQD